MSDVTEDRRRRRAAKTEITKQLSTRQFSARTRAFLDAVVFDGMDWNAAAKAAGIRQRVARVMWSHPTIIRELQRRATMIRTAEGSRNPAFLATIRDRGLAPEATAAQQKVSLEAAKALEGATDRPGVTVNLGVQVTPGLVIDLSGYSLPDGSRTPAPTKFDVGPRGFTSSAPLRKTDNL